MPTVLRVGPYRFFFYSGDRLEPPHVHVERGSDRAKVWLDPVRLQESGGFRRTDLARILELVRANEAQLLGRGMSTSPIEHWPALAESVTVNDDTLTVDLVDGRSIAVPLAWYPRLVHATPAERVHWRLIGRGEGVHWPDLDEDISVENLLSGVRSGESQRSLKEWLASRSR